MKAYVMFEHTNNTNVVVRLRKMDLSSWNLKAAFDASIPGVKEPNQVLAVLGIYPVNHFDKKSAAARKTAYRNGKWKPRNTYTYAQYMEDSTTARKPADQESDVSWKHLLQLT